MRFVANIMIGLAIVGMAAAGTLGHRAKTAVNDAFIYAGVRARLADVDVNSTSALHVSVDHGVVTLSGVARSIAERDAYVNVTWKVDGVKDVRNQISINPNFRGVRQTARDDALAVRVYGALVGQTGANAFHVTVHAKNGIVTLLGTVPSHSVEQTMVAAAQKVSGVRGVTDELSVRH